MNECVKPERATYEMVETFKRAWEAANLRHDPSDPPGTRTNAGLEAILALLPGRTEAEVKAEALREAAEIAVSSERGIPWDDDYDRATVAAWLDELADDA